MPTPLLLTCDPGPKGYRCRKKRLSKLIKLKGVGKKPKKAKTKGETPPPEKRTKKTTYHNVRHLGAVGRTPGARNVPK